MTIETNGDWQELAASWKEESASMSLDELHRHARRMRWKLLRIAIIQSVAYAIGLASAIWLILFTPMRYVGWGTALVISIFVGLVVRWQWHAQRFVAEPARKQIYADLKREERLLDILSAGRVVILSALAAVVIAASNHLRHLIVGGLSTLLALAVSALYLICAAVVSAWIGRRSRRRAAAYRYMIQNLDNEPESSPSPLDRKGDAT